MDLCHRKCFVRNIIRHYIFNSFIKHMNFIIYTGICKRSFPWEFIYWPSNVINVSLYSSWIDLLFIYCLVLYQGIIRWICSTCWKRTLKISYWLINQGKELREFILFIKLFVVIKMEAPKNSLKRITRQRIIPCLHESVGSRLPRQFTV